MNATMQRRSDDGLDAGSAPADALDQEFSIPSRIESAPVPRIDPRVLLRRRRRIVVAVVVGLVGILALQYVVGMLMAAQRQRHLAYEVTVPDRRIEPGEPTMVLQAPSIGLNAVVVEGASSAELRGGPGRVVGTARLEDAGNVVVLGRRTRFGAAFARLGELAKGDEIAARSRAGVVRTYTVESVTTTGSSSPKPLRSTDDRLTLVTSDDGVFPSRRLVVAARATAPPPAVGSTAQAAVAGTRPRLDAGALDERPVGVVGAALGFLLVGVVVIAGSLGIRRLRQGHRLATVVQVTAPLLLLVLVVSVVIGDTLLPVTY